MRPGGSVDSSPDSRRSGIASDRDGHAGPIEFATAIVVTSADAPAAAAPAAATAAAAAAAAAAAKCDTSAPGESKSPAWLGVRLP